MQLTQIQVKPVFKVPTIFKQPVDGSYCCRKTAVCIGDQLLDFSVPELGQIQSAFSINPEVLQNSAGFILCSSAGLSTRRMLCSNGFETMHVVCIGLLAAEFSTATTGLGRPMFWKARDLNCLSRK